MSMETPETPWERKLLTDLATSYLKGQRRAARWRLFFGVLAFIWVAVLCYRLIFVFGADSDTKKTGKIGHTAVIKFSGIIDDAKNPTRKLLQGMKAAYQDPNTKAIVIAANSPGGSPVLSGIAFDEILRLRKVYPKIPVYTAVQDACASGCYYMATATDKIFVDKASLVGSIGVVTSSFGFTGAMEKLGIERRLGTAGVNKAGNDPFSPINPETDRIQGSLLSGIHQQFVAAVKLGRGSRLKENEDTFTGRIWLGEEAIPLGLVDGFGTPASIARDIVKVPELVDFSPVDSFERRISRYLGTSISESFQDFFEVKLR